MSSSRQTRKISKIKDFFTRKKSHTDKSEKNIPYNTHSPDSYPSGSSILFVPGMGFTEKSVNIPLSQECTLRFFEYNTTIKAPYNFLKDKYTSFITDRVNRLVKEIYDMYVLNGFSLKIICHSHGALLTHRALKILGETYGKYFTKHMDVITYGGAKFIPFNHKKYILNIAINYIFENDWIFKRFTNKEYYNKYIKKYKLTTDLTIKDNNINLIIKQKSSIPPTCKESPHVCYPIYDFNFIKHNFCNTSHNQNVIPEYNIYTASKSASKTRSKSKSKSSSKSRSKSKNSSKTK